MAPQEALFLIFAIGVVSIGAIISAGVVTQLFVGGFLPHFFIADPVARLLVGYHAYFGRMFDSESGVATPNFTVRSRWHGLFQVSYAIAIAVSGIVNRHKIVCSRNASGELVKPYEIRAWRITNLRRNADGNVAMLDLEHANRPEAYRDLTLEQALDLVAVMPKWRNRPHRTLESFILESEEVKKFKAELGGVMAGALAARDGVMAARAEIRLALNVMERGGRYKTSVEAAEVRRMLAAFLPVDDPWRMKVTQDPGKQRGASKNPSVDNTQ